MRAAAFLLCLFFVLTLIGMLGTAAAGEEETPVTVSGRVVDEAGKPLAGVRIHAGLYVTGNSARTDADGRFALRLRWTDKVPLHIWTNGYLETRVEVAAGTHDLTVTLAVGTRVRGRLAVPEGTAMPGQVRIVTRRAAGWSNTAKVSPDGRFEIGGFEPGPAERFGLWAEGLMPVLVGERVVEADQPLGLGTVTLRRGRLVTVRVRDHEEKPVEGARVRVQSTVWNPFLWDADTDATGTVRIPAAVEDRLRVTVRGPHTDSDDWFAEIPAGAKAADASVQIEHPVTLVGTLVWGGRSAPPWAGEHGIEVTVVAGDDPRRPRYWHGRTLGGGSAAFRIPGCTPGDWRNAEIRVAVGKHWSVVPRPLAIPRLAKPRDPFDLGALRVAPPAAK